MIQQKIGTWSDSEAATTEWVIKKVAQPTKPRLLQNQEPSSRIFVLGFLFFIDIFFGLGSEQTKVWATIETKNSQQKLFEHNVSSIPQYQQNMVWVDHAGWTHCLKRNFFVCVVWTAKSHLVDFCWPKKNQPLCFSPTAKLCYGVFSPD